MPHYIPISSHTASLQNTTNVTLLEMRDFFITSQPINEEWLFFVYLTCFFLFLFLKRQYQGRLFENIRYFLSSRKQQTQSFFTEQIKSFWFRILMPIFTIAVFSVAIYLFLYEPPKTFSLLTYGYLCIVTSLFFLFKRLVFSLLGYVFFDNKQTHYYQQIYFRLFFLLIVILFPILFFYTYQTIFSLNLYSILVITVLSFYIVLIIKLFQMFFYKSIAYLYIILYLCTLEIMPLFLLFRMYSNIL